MGNCGSSSKPEATPVDTTPLKQDADQLVALQSAKDALNAKCTALERENMEKDKQVYTLAQQLHSTKQDLERALSRLQQVDRAQDSTSRGLSPTLLHEVPEEPEELLPPRPPSSMPSISPPSHAQRSLQPSPSYTESSAPSQQAGTPDLATTTRSSLEDSAKAAEEFAKQLRAAGKQGYLPAPGRPPPIQPPQPATSPHESGANSSPEVLLPPVTHFPKQHRLKATAAPQPSISGSGIKPPNPATYHSPGVHNGIGRFDASATGMGLGAQGPTGQAAGFPANASRAPVREQQHSPGEDSDEADEESTANGLLPNGSSHNATRTDLMTTTKYGRAAPSDFKLAMQLQKGPKQGFV